MKIIILHGDHTGALYERLKKFQEVAIKRGWLIEEIEPSLLKEKVLSPSLIAPGQLFLLRGIKGLGKNDLLWLKKNSQKLPGTLVVYNEGILSPTFLKSLPKEATIEEYKLPKLVFQLLDSLYPGNSKRALILLHQTLEKEPPEFVFYLVARYYRDLYWVKVGNGLPYQAWRVGKLKALAKRYSENSLKEALRKLSRIDIDIKTGKTNAFLSLDLFLANALE